MSSKTDIINPRGKTPVDKDLWEWAYTNYGATMAKAIKVYKKQFLLKHNNKEAFIAR